MDQDILEICEVLRQHPKLIIADDFEIVAQKRFEASHRFQNGHSVDQSRKESVWVSLRILHRRQPGVAVTNEKLRAGLDLLVENAFESAKYSSVDPYFRFPLWKFRDVGESQKMAELPHESLYSRVESLPFSFDENYFHGSEETVLFRKTEKKHLQKGGVFQKLKFSLLCRPADDFFRVWDEKSSINAWNKRELALESLKLQAMGFFDATPWDEDLRETPFVLGPQVVTQFLCIMSDYFFANQIHSGRSVFCESIGKEIFSRHVSIIDDATLAGGERSTPFDMEGTLTQRTLLVSEGYLLDALHDCYTATRDNRLSTGSLFRDGGRCRIRESNLYLLPGELPKKELLATIGNGVLLQAVERLELSENHRIVSLIAHGWRVEQGECVDSMRNIHLSIDLLELFKSVDAVCSDLTFFGHLGSPSILVRKMPLR